jgi:type II secretory pathway pseudopilin PulG
MAQNHTTVPVLINHRNRGFTYIGLLFAVAILGTGLASTGIVWHIAQQREKERELLFIGQQFRFAIERYYLSTPEGVKKFPLRLEDLLLDPRQPMTQRYLRRIYIDPMTGKDEWGLVKAADGGIMGVYSLSDQAPVKQAQFRNAERFFDGREKYSEWRFIAQPRAAVTGSARRSASANPGR